MYFFVISLLPKIISSYVNAIMKLNTFMHTVENSSS